MQEPPLAKHFATSVHRTELTDIFHQMIEKIIEGELCLSFWVETVRNFFNVSLIALMLWFYVSYRRNPPK
jgi:hypothetical protein